jgi:peptide/nickel transport system permease protein
MSVTELTLPAAAETQRASVLRRLLRRPSAVIATAVVAAFVIIAVGAPHVAPYDPVKQDFRAIRKAPSDAYRLGTDEVGRDVLSRLIWGARASLLAGVIPVSIALVVSLPLGLLSGCTGGWLDGLIMRITDAMLAIPFLIVAIALAAFLGPSLTNAMIAIGIAALPTFLRLARGTASNQPARSAARAGVSPCATCCPISCRRCSSSRASRRRPRSSPSPACRSWASASNRRHPRGAACSTPPSATWCRRRGWRSIPG